MSHSIIVALYLAAHPPRPRSRWSQALAAAVSEEYTRIRRTACMRIRNGVLVSLATLGCVVAQEPNPGPRENQSVKSKLDFTFPQFRPQKRSTPQNAVADFNRRLDNELIRPQSRSTPRNRLTRPTVNLLPPNAHIPPPCSIPLLEAQIPKDTHFMIRRLRPRMDALTPMPTVSGPAPSCADRK